MYERKPNIPDFLTVEKVQPVYNVDNYAKELKYKLQTAQLNAREFLLSRKMNRKRNTKYDEKANCVEVKPGELVKVVRENRTKFEPKYSGPYEVVSVETPNITLKSSPNGKIIKVHKDRIAKCFLR